jgi:MGT family glycosyltransferase
MTRFAFVTWDGGGNVPPAVGIAQELVERGHDVVFIGYEVQRTAFHARGLPFKRLPRSGNFDIYGVADPAERIRRLIAHVWANEAHVAEIAETAAATSADVLVVDFLMQGAIASATRLAAPFAVLAHSTVAGLTPPPASPMGAARLEATNALRRESDLAELVDLADAWAGVPTIVTTIKSLDAAPVRPGDPSMHYVGPVFERVPQNGWVSPWPKGDDRPLVLVSFSTTALWDHRAPIRNTLGALANEPVRVLVTAAQRIDVGAIPANALVARFVAHRQVLPSVALTVTHGGHGTVSASLAAGVPLIVLPNLAADQPFLAARVDALGAGLALDRSAPADAIAAAARDVLGNPSYRAAAENVAGEISRSSGPRGAAEILEGVAGR